ncbi:hypothetical protein [Nocardia brasiliensis]|uniref:hypothetical protein n=1 Tax=Nocardia brasiliensis TaxID=37326 RepID=UPI003670D666
MGDDLSPNQKAVSQALVGLGFVMLVIGMVGFFFVTMLGLILALLGFILLAGMFLFELAMQGNSPQEAAPATPPKPRKRWNGIGLAVPIAVLFVLCLIGALGGFS